MQTVSKLNRPAINAIAIIAGLAASQVASATIIGDSIEGTLQHAGLSGFNNWNVASANGPRTETVVDPGVEFSIPPGNGNFGFVIASADFAATTIQLVVGNPQQNGDLFSSPFDMYFADLDYGNDIHNIQLVSSDFPDPPTFSFGPDTFEAHLPTGFIPGNTSYTATFAVTIVPEPGVLALAGLTLFGLMRRR